MAGIVARLHYAVPAQLPHYRYPSIVAWYGRIESLPAWREAVPRV